MPPNFQNLQIKAFSLGHEHTLALDRKGQVYCRRFVKVHKTMHVASNNKALSNRSRFESVLCYFGEELSTQQNLPKHLYLHTLYVIKFHKKSGISP